MIKKILFSLFVSFVGLISFSSAGYTRQIGNYGFNPYVQSYYINFVRTGNPLTQSLGYTKQMFVFYQGDFTWANNGSTAPVFITWFWYNGLPYFYIYRGYYRGDDTDYFKQGNVTTYKVCNEITTIENTSVPSNCVTQNIGETTSDILGNYFSHLTNNDYFYFDYSWAWWDQNSLNLDFCISSSFDSSSICFNVNGNSTLSDSISLSKGLTFDGFNTSYLENPPFNNGGGQDGKLPEENSSVVYFPCTNGDALDYYKNKGYTKNLCYGGDYFWDLGTESYAVKFLTPGVGYNYYDIYEHLNGATGTGNTYLTGNQLDVRFNYWRSQYTWWTTQSISNVSPFSGYPQVLFGLFDFINRYGISYSTESIIDYCNLELYQNPEGLDMLYNGYNHDIACNNNGVVVEIPGIIDGSGNITSGGVGNGIGSSWGNTFSGDIFSGSNYTGGSNPSVFIKDLVDDIKAKFSEFDVSGNTVGFLPAYIVVALFGIIIFNFLRK